MSKAQPNPPTSLCLHLWVIGKGKRRVELHTYYICLLRKGPNWTADESPELEQLQAQHMAHISHLMEIGAKLAAGPVDDDSDIRGFSIYLTPTLAEAQAFAEDDPAVRSGRFVVELHPWMVPVGRLPAPAGSSEESRKVASDDSAAG